VGAFEKERAVVRTKRTWLFVVGMAVGLLGFVPALSLFLYGVWGHPVWMLGIVVYYGAFFGVLHAWNRWWLERRGVVRADESGLWLDRQLVVARRNVRHGHVVHREGNAYVRLGRMLRLVEVAVSDADDGEALLVAMRLDPSRSVGVYPMTHGSYWSSWLKAGLAFAVSVGTMLGVTVMGRFGLLLPALVIMMLPIGAWGLDARVSVSVGADGIRVRRLLSGARFIPFGALASAETDGREVTLRLRDGKVVRMHHPAGKGWKPAFFHDRADEGRQLVARIKTLAEQHARAGADLSMLARGTRTTSEWLRDVAHASDEHASFRTPAVPPDVLWRIVEDPTMVSTARAGAAIALRTGLDDEGRARLRVLADACASPRLRIALEHTASSAALLPTTFDPLDDAEAPGPLRKRPFH
jgi:hypothetical protein